MSIAIQDRWSSASGYAKHVNKKIICKISIPFSKCCESGVKTNWYVNLKFAKPVMEILW